MSILIAEDDQHLRDGIVDLLSLEGYTCRVADDGAKALALFLKEKPDICVFDVMMPVMDGLTPAARSAQARSGGADPVAFGAWRGGRSRARPRNRRR